MTDGGPENISDPSLPVVRQVAGVDIRFSYSLVESVNKVVKYQSLYLHDIANVTKLREHLKEWIPVYNNERPHSSLAPLTPTEVHEGQIPDTSVFREQIKDGRRERIEANRREVCPVCGPAVKESRSKRRFAVTIKHHSRSKSALAEPTDPGPACPALVRKFEVRRWV